MIDTSRAHLRMNLVPDARVFAFTAAVCVMAVVLFGILPAWRTSRAAIRTGRLLGPSAGRYTSARSISGRMLVVAQVALSLPLVAAAGLFGTTLHNLRDVNTGFDHAHLVSFALSPRQAGFDATRTRQLYSDVTARLELLPGVNAVATSTKPPLARGFHQLIAVDGLLPNVDNEPSAGVAAVSAGYFRVTGAEIVRGRGFSDTDADAGQKVVVINEAAAEAWFPGRDAIGQRLASAGRSEVGIARSWVSFGMASTMIFATQRRSTCTRHAGRMTPRGSHCSCARPAIRRG
jgi:putative ABC transport system permease protein